MSIINFSIYVTMKEGYKEVEGSYFEVIIHLVYFKYFKKL